MTKAKLVTLQAVPGIDGLHLVLPPTVTRALYPHLPPGQSVPIHALIAGGAVQLTYEKLELSIPAIALKTEEFVMEAEPTPAT